QVRDRQPRFSLYFPCYRLRLELSWSQKTKSFHGLVTKLGYPMGPFTLSVAVDFPVSCQRRVRSRLTPPPNIIGASSCGIRGDHQGERADRLILRTPLWRFVTGLVVSAASSTCRNRSSSSSTAFPKAPSWPARTIATDGCSSNDGGRNTFTKSIDWFLTMKRAGNSPTP